MSDDWPPEPSALSVRSGREGALDAALQRLVPGHLPDRPDAPDLQITAVRRLPAVSARYAPFPEALDRRLQDALVARGISQLYSHQAHAITSFSAIPTWSIRESCRIIPVGRSCSKPCATSSSTSCTRIAEYSGAISATCCVASAASAGTTGRIRSSCARRRRLRTRGSL